MSRLPSEKPPEGTAFAIGDTVLLPVTIHKWDMTKRQHMECYVKVKCDIPGFANSFWVGSEAFVGRALIRVVIRDFRLFKQLVQVEAKIPAIKTRFWVPVREIVRIPSA
jgi:hypothetical protein